MRFQDFATYSSVSTASRRSSSVEPLSLYLERHSVIPPHLERESIILAESASRHGHQFAHQYLGFFEAL